MAEIVRLDSSIFYIPSYMLSNLFKNTYSQNSNFSNRETSREIFFATYALPKFLNVTLKVTLEEVMRRGWARLIAHHHHDAHCAAIGCEAL
jgi:hypothetical protein